MKMAEKPPGSTRWIVVFLAFSLSPGLADQEIRRAFPDGNIRPREPEVRLAERASPSPADHSAETIRFGPVEEDPTAAAKTQLDAANSLYVKKMYDLAIPEYKNFLDTYPQADGRNAALFRLAESHRFLGHKDLASEGYHRLIQEFSSGEFTGAAAYRLGEIFLSDQNYSSALGQFQLASKNLQEGGVRLAALFYQARCLEALNYKGKAVALYQQVASIGKNNPFYHYALMAIAQADADAGHKESALNKFDQVVKTAHDPAIRAEANVRGAALAASLNQTESALSRFHDAIATGPAEWKSTAWLGLLQLYYQKEEYSRIVTHREQALAALSKNILGDGLLLIANSYRQLGDFKEALQTYERVIQGFPQSKAANEAQFQRLVCLYSLEDPRLLDAIDAYGTQINDPQHRSQVLLLKAETLFRSRRYSDAVVLFRNAQQSELSAHLKQDALYKLGWCYAYSGQPKEAVLTYSQFIEKYPTHSLIASAWLQRGLARQQINETAAALNDYDSLIAHFPQAREREVALLQRALLLGARDDRAGMVQAFQQLLSDYPKSVAVAQAHFWIGWAAYENKDYKSAIDYLNKARGLDRVHYQERASLRILLAYYYLKNVEAASREALIIKTKNIPSEILRWLGIESFQRGQYSDAEHYLSLLQKNADAAAFTSEVYLALAQSQLKLRKYLAALSTIESYLATARDPVARGQGLFVKAQVLKEEGKIEEALKLIAEAQLLQPEGIANARARLLEADLRMIQQDYSKAGRDYMAVALLYDDPQLAPQALKSAIQAYRQAHSSVDEERALNQLKKRFPSESIP